MQTKYVYLFELDSVRNSDKEIMAAQQALYDEIVTHGNIVVMTYNQLADSCGFFRLLTNNKYYQNLLQLFEGGRIRISQFSDIRTISQYLQDSVDEDRQFYYSALPLKFTQKRLLALVRRSLACSDLSEIRKYLPGGTGTKEELLDLFLEVLPQEDHSFELKSRSEEEIPQLQKIMQSLYDFLHIILQLSSNPAIYLSPRDPEELRGLRMHDILEMVMDLDWPEEDSLRHPAFQIIQSLLEKGKDNRSIYLRQLKVLAEDSRNDKQVLQYAEAIIDLCYNYTMEISIYNTSKRYNVAELQDREAPKPTFQKDFLHRLKEYWRDGDQADQRFLQKETDTIQTSQLKIPDFGNAVRLLHYETEEAGAPSQEVFRYEYREKERQEEQKKHLLSIIHRQLRSCLYCFLIACGIELLFNGLEDQISLPIHDTIMNIFKTILLLIASEYFSVGLQALFPDREILSLSEALGGMVTLIKDARFIRKIRPEEIPAENLQPEPAGTPVPIDYVRSKALKSYVSFYREHRELFRQNTDYQVADVSSSLVQKNLVRSEELYHYRFGRIYASPFNTLLVDPILGRQKQYYPYERVLPTAGDGVVIVPVYEGKLILLNQYRHALQGRQYCFPRGFSEPHQTPEENVKRELSEELHAVPIREPICLGRIAPDSGLTSRMTAVYLVQIDHYEVKTGYEGIHEVKECTPEQLKTMIRKEELTDGYTIGAFTQYLLRETNTKEK
jgi:ADP-ribose pyrophosphatase YjhB (NUDIX family)